MRATRERSRNLAQCPASLNHSPRGFPDSCLAYGLSDLEAGRYGLWSLKGPKATWVGFVEMDATGSAQKHWNLSGPLGPDAEFQLTVEAVTSELPEAPSEVVALSTRVR